MPACPVRSTARAPLGPIDRTAPPFRDDPVIAALTDEQIYLLAGLMVEIACLRVGAARAGDAADDAPESDVA